jgi:hypothetical protein
MVILLTVNLLTGCQWHQFETKASRRNRKA